MKKQQLTHKRAANIFKSTQFMTVMAELIKIEFMMHMDVDFRNPVINHNVSRIKQSAELIQLHLSAIIKTKDAEFREEYAAELHRVFNHFIGLDIEAIRDFMDAIDELVKEQVVNN